MHRTTKTQTLHYFSWLWGNDVSWIIKKETTDDLEESLLVFQYLYNEDYCTKVKLYKILDVSPKFCPPINDSEKWIGKIMEGDQCLSLLSSKQAETLLKKYASMLVHVYIQMYMLRPLSSEITKTTRSDVSDHTG